MSDTTYKEHIAYKVGILKQHLSVCALHLVEDSCRFIAKYDDIQAVLDRFNSHIINHKYQDELERLALLSPEIYDTETKMFVFQFFKQELNRMDRVYNFYGRPDTESPNERIVRRVCIEIDRFVARDMKKDNSSPQSA